MKAEKLLEIIDVIQDLVSFFNDPTNDRKMLEKAGIQYSENLLPIIVLLGSKKVNTVGQLARSLGRDHSSMSRKIASLQKRGLLKSSTVPNDLRIHKLLLTKQGEDLFKTITNTREQVMSQVMDSLSDKDINEILTSLKKLTTILKDNLSS